MALPVSEPIIPEQLDPFQAPGFSAGTALPGSVSPADSDNRRTHLRNPIEVSRPIAVRPAPNGREAIDPWRSATILDLSPGGLCLFLLAEEDFELPERLLLDLTNQPGFGVSRLSVSLRWYVAHAGVVTLGVGFDGPLEPLPQLV